MSGSEAVAAPSPPRVGDSTISTAELRRRLGEPGLDVVDVRPLPPSTAGANGRGPRRPHPGGRRASRRVAARLDDAEVVRLLLDDKGIVAERARSSSTATARGRPAGPRQARRARPCRRCASTRTAWPSWAADERLPVERLPELRQARPHRPGSAGCSPASTPEAAPPGKFLLFHVNFGVPEEYAEDHLPGALYLDTNWLENPARLEPALARGARRGAPRARASPTTRRSSSTAATPRATRTRSGRAAGPARSRPPGRR